MKTIISYIKDYIISTDKKVLIITSIFTAVLIFLNYYYRLDERIKNNSFVIKLSCWYVVFAFAFLIPYLFYTVVLRRTYTHRKHFLLLAFLAPAIFSLKMALDIRFNITSDPGWNRYWNHILYWPLLGLIIGMLLLIVWRLFDREQPLYGLRTKGVDWKPYLLMLLIMVPLIAVASTQEDFLAIYPKLQSIGGIFEDDRITWGHKLLYELSYGSDFLSIELFFRGFLVLAFIKWAGKDAILPMACFYCTIHFGKPLAECISSFFGGILLGIIVYNTRSILGGLVVHLGIAWLMELGGYIGNNLR